MYKPFTLQNRSGPFIIVFQNNNSSAFATIRRTHPMLDSSHFRSMDAVRTLGDGFWGETFSSFRVIRSFASEKDFLFCVTREIERESRKAFMWRAQTLQFAKFTDQKEKVYRCSSFREVGERVGARFNFLWMDIFLVCLHKHEISMNLISVPFAFSMGNLFMRLSFMTAKDVFRLMPT